MSRDWMVTVRPITERDIKLCDAGEKANVVDSGAAVIVDGELLAITDEYGTAILRAGTDLTPTADVVERFASAVSDFYGALL